MSSKNYPTLKSRRIKAGITIGDPSGIGPAVTLKALNRLDGLADFVVIGDKWVLGKSQVSIPKSQAVNLIDLNNVHRKHFSFGKIKAQYGRASVEYLLKALGMLREGEIDCLVTAPISKEAINKAGFRYAGHTEFLGEQTRSEDLVMMLMNERLKFSLVTRHIPLKDVSSSLNSDAIKSAITVTHEYLKKLFLIPSPRIAVCGLNPHSSDNGLFGNEENKIIKPLISRLRQRITRLYGPVSADIAVLRAMRKEYDCLIAMYHDQALIPLKLSGGNLGANITLGLPFVRTSPLHGTAFDIAGQPELANPDSMVAAIKLAVQCTSNLKKD